MTTVYTRSLVNGLDTLLLFFNPISESVFRKLVFDNLNKLVMFRDLPVIFNHGHVTFVLLKWAPFAHFAPSLFGQKITATKLHSLKPGCMKEITPV